MERQQTVERSSDTVYKIEYIFIHDTTTNTVHDTVRETTTVHLNADGDTTRKDTEREHITDRTHQQKAESVHETTQKESHENETTDEKKETTVEQPKGANPVKSFVWGLVAGIGIIIAIRLIRLFRK